MTEEPLPKLTIITPVMNGAQFLEGCIRNVAAQQCDAVEHLVMDGGSRDGTRELLERLAREVPRLRWISEPDRGQSDAMNKGIAQARGALISFLNADDTYEPGVFRRVLGLAEKHAAPAFFTGNCTQVDGEGRLIKVYKPREFGWLKIVVRRHADVFPINPASYFYHRGIHDLVGGYDESEHLSMDLDFLLRVARTVPCHYYDENWGVMRYMAGGKSFENSSRGENDNAISRIVERDIARAPLRWKLLARTVLAVNPIRRALLRLVKGRR